MTMKDMLQNIDFKKLIRDPKLYYILVPLVCALWPIWVGLVSLPAAQKTWQGDMDLYAQAEKVIIQIHDLDPERFTAAQNQGKAAAFNYPTAVDQVARSCGIPAAEYKLQSSAVMKSQGGQQVQDADVTLKQVSITTFAKFLSTMQVRWADLQCTSLKLTKQKGTADTWKADMKFKFYF
jgi:hypothetical protein